MKTITKLAYLSGFAMLTFDIVNFTARDSGSRYRDRGNRTTECGGFVNTMQKLINHPENFVEEMLDGILKGHPAELRRADNPRAVVRTDAPVGGKVAIATSGGSGHLLFS
jgi:hypothetical protein